ncbi:MAG: aspartate carbamoyltransferase catalytic subunit [Actinoplanes sp.]|jgi:aspartate carbamoyltransferase catalytic subunit|nr:aspartate carbamoyltransferase catalytic subunit [Actinoplanes sp.]
MSCLDRLAGRSIISIHDLSREELLGLFSVAARLQAGVVKPAAPLAGKILLTAFFEPSTRTRLSFESAAHRLGAAVIGIPDARSTSIHKGESLADTGFMLGTYADIVVLRHTADSSVHDIRAAGMTASLINGGNGCDEHPTQAMADWYALLKWRTELAEADPPADRRISLGMLGTPARMRSMRSFLLAAATHFPRAVRELLVVSDDPDPLGADLTAALTQAGVSHRCASGLQVDLAGLDVIYQNSLTLVDQEYQVLGSKIRLDADTVLRSDAVVMHPLARQDELSTDLDDTPHNLYFDQVEGAAFIRQALLLAIAGELDCIRR